MLRALCGEIVVPQAGRSPQNLFAFAQLCYFAPPQQARSSVVEHHLDMVVVGGSIPLAPTRVNEIARKRARIRVQEDAHKRARLGGREAAHSRPRLAPFPLREKGWG